MYPASLSKLAFGTGGRFGRLDRSEAFELVSFAFANGIAVFDTGVPYCNGRSQLLLYKSLAHLGVERKSFSICTKISAEALLASSKSEIVSMLFSGFQDQLSYLDTVMLWGPSLRDLANLKAINVLRDLQSSGIIGRIGVNTHHARVMNHLIGSSELIFVDDLMVDFNILQNSRAPIINRFTQSRASRQVWAGTSLCQGFLLQSLFSMYIRTRSVSYLARAFWCPATRVYLKKASSIRRLLRKSFGLHWRRVPLSFALNESCVSHVPVGMLSKLSISENIDIEYSPVDASLVRDFVLALPGGLVVDDVFA